MSAIPKLRPITVQPILRPDYIVNAATMRSLEAFLDVNGSECERYYNELRAVDDEDFCTLREFQETQYDVQRQYWLQYDLESRDEPGERPASMYDRETGIATRGEI